MVDNNSAFIPGGMYDFINDPAFNPGGLPDRVDTRDYTYREVGGATAPFDWNVGFDVETIVGKLPVKDQNGSYSCGGQAWSTLSAILEAIATGTSEERSAKFFYAQTYQEGGGSTGRDNAEIYKGQGAARESVLTSYPATENFLTKGQDITLAVRNNALLDKSLSYAQVGSNINEIARVIRDTGGVILGVDGENNGTWTSEFPKPPNTVNWRHWVCACKAKLINGKKFIGFINSWGLTVGDKGIQWLGEDYFSGHIFSSWTHIFATAPTPGFKHNFSKNIAYGQQNNEVVALKTALALEGVFPASVSTAGTYYGLITAKAVLDFRLKYGISSTSDPEGKVAGPLTRTKLNSIFNV